MSMKKLKVSVIGSGSFGTALGTLSARCGHNVLMFSNNQTTIKEVNEKHVNLRYFPADVVLPPNLKATDSMEECLNGSSMIIHAIPVQKSVQFFKDYSSKIPNNIPYIISSKGILLEEKKFFSEIWDEIFPKERKISHCVLSGPSFAIEIIKQAPTVVTLASQDKEITKFVQQNLHTSSFKTYVTDDVKGVEIGGALKNPLAIGAGIVEGLGYGINTNAALVTRGLFEMGLFSEKFGGRHDTLFGLSGVGDVMLTCLGKLSRNKSVGVKLAEGKTIDQILADSNEVAEGIPTLFVLDEMIKKHNLNMPVFKMLSKVVKGQVSPIEAAKYLMLRDLEGEKELKI
jgi:glycerol-3-phosphate dehydrogenase (NAD(P)+)